MKKIMVINGPNLNLLGNRERKIYGDLTLSQIEKLCNDKAIDLNLELHFNQSNSESQIIELIHDVENRYDALIINPAAFTHTSIAILDALRTINKPKIEIHLSNIYNREDYRKNSLTASGVDGTICGFGHLSYIMAIEGINSILKNDK